MAATRLSTQRLKRKVLYVCSDARFLGDEIVRLANEAKDPRQALQLAARAQNLFRCQRSTVRRPQASLPVCSR